MAAEARTTNVNGPPRVVILGSGYGGVYTALKLRKAAKRGQIELSLISRHNFFLCQPMLSEVVSGSIEPTHILSPTRRMLPYANLHQAEISSIDLASRSVVINYLGSQPHLDRVPFDHLVIAVGSRTDLSDLPGMAEHTFPFKTMGDAFSLRNHLISVLEEAEVESDPHEKEELLTFVIAGGGYTGVEVAAEINSFIREAAGSYRHIKPDEVRVILLHGGTRILPVLNDALAAFSHRVMEKRGVEIRLNTRMAGATAQSAILREGEIIPTRTVVAAVGSAPNLLLDDIPGDRDRSGRLVVDATLAVPGLPGVWSIGDCAAIPDVRTGGTCPPTAQYAVREAEHVAGNILASIKGTRLRQFSHRNLGVFVPLGRWSGAADLMGLRISGFLAWWLYRSYYLWQLPRLERKLRVVMDWTMELLFHRDIVQMDIARSEGISRSHYEPGEIIYQEGELARNFYTILSGEVQVVRQREGEDNLVATLGPGEFFGEISLLQGGRHSALVRAHTPVDLLIMNGDDFKALATSSTHFGELLDDIMQRRLGTRGDGT